MFVIILSTFWGISSSFKKNKSSLLTASSAKLEIITNSSHGNPSGVPFGISMWWGHPHPQKLNLARSLLPSAGLLVDKSLKVCSNGIVTDDWTDVRLISWSPDFTENT